MQPERVMETEEFELVCMVAVQNGTESNFWKSCEWRRNSDKISCIQKAVNDWVAKVDNCVISVKPIEKRVECRIKILSASADDREGWTCTLRKCLDEESGGCSSNYASTCSGTSNVTVKV